MGEERVTSMTKALHRRLCLGVRDPGDQTTLLTAHRHRIVLPPVVRAEAQGRLIRGGR